MEGIMANRLETRPPAAAPAVDIVDAFQRATETDLEAVRSRIVECQRQLDSLEAVEKALNIRLHGKPEKRKWTKAKPPPASANGTQNGAAVGLLERRHKVCRHLRAKGALHRDALAEQTGIAKAGQNCLTTVLDCDWFHVAPNGLVSLTDKGDRAVL